MIIDDAQQIRIFTEIGFGNPSFISTEVEKGEREHRIRGFVKMKLKCVYLRVWIGRKVFVVSSRRGFSVNSKPKTRFKLLLGFEGEKR